MYTLGIILGTVGVVWLFFVLKGMYTVITRHDEQIAEVLKALACIHTILEEMEKGDE